MQQHGRQKCQTEEFLLGNFIHINSTVDKISL
jgi:hypothetical protein